MLEINFTEGGQRGKAIRLNFEKAWFGRQATCDFVLQGENVSRVHFSIEKRGTDYVLIDNKSTNGTFVNSVRATVVTLRPGDDIAAGSNRMQVREVAVVSATESGVQSGQRAGAGMVVGIADGSRRAAALRQAGATHVADGVDAIPELVLSSGTA